MIIEAHRIGYRIEGDSVISPTNRVLKLHYDRDGYPVVGISVNGKPATIFVHRMAAFQYYGMETFLEGNCVQHLDNDKTNFKKENLKVGNYSENEKHKYKTGTSIKKRTSSKPLERKMIIDSLFAAKETNESQTEIAKRLGVTRKRVNAINNIYFSNYLKNINKEYSSCLDDLLM
jgi:hypothetical protein